MNMYRPVYTDLTKAYFRAVGTRVREHAFRGLAAEGRNPVICWKLRPSPSTGVAA